MSWLQDSTFVWWTLGLGAVMLVGSVIGAAIVLVRLPADYFLLSPESRPTRSRSGWAWRIAKNLLGGLLLIAGIAMLFLPGQGVLTILIGIMLLDFPGKRKFEMKLLRRPGVLSAINRLRARFGRQPIVFENQARELTDVTV